MLEFHFFGSIHTAVQGDFSTPCQMGSLIGSGFDSGPINNKADGSGNVFQVMVQNTNPMWFYCATPTHCQGGMAGVVNPPSSGNSLATYKANAAGTSSSQSVGKVQGGVVIPAGGSSSSSSPGPSPSKTPVSTASPTPAPTTSSAPVSSSVSLPKSASSKSLGTSTALASTSLNSSSRSVTSHSVTSSVSGSATSSAITTPTFATTSRGGSLMEMTGRTVLSSFVFGLGVVVVLMT